MSTNLKLTIGVVVVAVAMVAAVILTTRGSGQAGPEALVRPESHRLSTAADGKVTVVEFLDFECEACGAAYPGVEKLRKEYNGKITYVVRLFPLPGHRNGEPAARAAQAAANQGKFEAMYTKLFDNQKTWGEQRVDQSPVFQKYAAEIGLDMSRFQADFASQAVIDRVAAEVKDGMALDLTGTPTFFVNGKKHDGDYTYESLKKAVDAELAK
ncbi:DsbA family protein [Longispora albida]|uniref:DsbA family protein n=1 Tax=Longispora albida TaxID=203523 RepID=UPI000364B37E|nr:thioredoxin domain-containing protein [Longispora albida]